MSGIRARRKAERPGEILEAAFEQFILKGYAATRLEDVAERLGITKGTIYFYFESKEAVFEACIQTVASAPLAEFNREEFAWTGDIARDLHGYLHRLYQFIAKTPRSRETLRLLVAEANRFPTLVDSYFRSFMDPIVGRLKTKLAEAAAAGKIREIIAYMPEVLMSPPMAYHVMLLLFAGRRTLDVEAVVRAHVQLLLHGLLPAGTPAADDTAGWTPWRPFPAPRHGGMLTAPLGPGVYQLRRTGQPPQTGSARGVAAWLAKLPPADDLEYRTLGCATYPEARRIARDLGGGDTAS